MLYSVDNVPQCLLLLREGMVSIGLRKLPCDMCIKESLSLGECIRPVRGVGIGFLALIGFGMAGDYKSYNFYIFGHLLIVSL